MKILVNGREAVLKANASFEYVRENPLFTEAEDYTMEIPFPMKDCPQNISIFGPLHVKGVDISKVSFPCEIQTDAFVKSGILTITSVSDTEVKGQFLEGMSQQNFASSVPDVYLTDLDFSQWDGQDGGWENYQAGPDFGWDDVDVWDSAKSKVVQGMGRSNTGESVIYTYSHKIYLSHLITLVGRAIGWQIDQSALLAIPMFRFVLVLNTRHLLTTQRSPSRPLNSMLPKWTVKEFLQEIALFFGCVCYIRANDKMVIFCACKNMALSSNSAGTIDLAVLDDFEIEISEEKNQYRGNISYKLPDACNPNKINNCPDVESDKRLLHYSCTMEQFLKTAYSASQPKNVIINNTINHWYGLYDGLLYYLTDIDRFGVVVETQEEYVDPSATDDTENYLFRCQRIDILNQFNLPAEGRELKISPCLIEYHVKDESGREPIDYTDIPSIGIPEDFDEVASARIGYENLKPAIDIVSSGTRGEDEFYYDKLWLALVYINENGVKFVHTRKYEPHTIYSSLEEYVGNVLKDDEGKIRGQYITYDIREYDYTLSPSDPSIQSLASLPKVDETKLYRYKFLAKTLPSPTSVFLIKGKRYACLKLTAQITVKGMSELVEGEFYEIID
ncbi:MAG: hypothetical protein IJV81_01310 [Paludibacteraceae bacterium]|nr:hypothetical protein [Paludibacteraceae bacterium]